MSSGRPDYNTKVVPSPERFGDDESKWGDFVLDSVNAGAIKDFFTYTVPTGYELYITLIIFTCVLPGINAGDVRVNDVTKLSVWFDISLILPFTGTNYFKCVAGDVLLIKYHNADSVAVQFALSVKGYLKSIT